MAEFDQGKAKRNAGTAPIQTPKKKMPPRIDYVPGDEAPVIAKKAYDLSQQQAQDQLDNVVAKGRQPGFTKASVEGVLEDFEEK